MEATNPVNVPVTGLETAPKPTLGAVQRRVLPEPVQVPAVPVEAVDVDAAVSTAAAEEVACVVLDLSFEKRGSGAYGDGLSDKGGSTANEGSAGA